MLSNNIFSQLETLHPNIASELSVMIDLAKKSTDTELLELCKSYIDAALLQQHWDKPERPLTEKEQAFIAFTEQFVSSVGTMSDDQVELLLQFASADEVYNFVNAIYVTDLSSRLEWVIGRVL
tara:strand:+ start:634 stop:1002 length:369 start_codon:yes stop_codon:yes gene_type:complete